jgi:hypothetical protein
VSLGAIATRLGAVVTTAAGYVVRLLQDWRADRSKRDDRQREIAGKAQVELDNALA